MCTVPKIKGNKLLRLLRKKQSYAIILDL